MQLTAPVTDYIRASMLTTRGDMVLRGVTVPERMARNATWSFLCSNVNPAYPQWRSLEQTAGLYYKARGAGELPLFEPLSLSDGGIWTGIGTRNAGGDQVIAGVGFQPSVVFFLACDDVEANMNWSVGFDKLTSFANLNCKENNSKINVETTRSIYISRGAGNFLQGSISAFGADGFTIDWVIGGACVVDYVYLCLP